MNRDRIADLQAKEQASGGTVSASEAEAEAEAEPVRDGDGSPMHPQLERDSSGTYWEVKSGDTLYDIYRYLRANENVVELGAVTADLWAGFLARVSKLNAGREDWDIIIPGERIYLERRNRTLRGDNQ